jgi:hypothetical protein
LEKPISTVPVGYDAPDVVVRLPTSSDDILTSASLYSFINLAGCVDIDAMLERGVAV